jgi:hypothetical protein
MMLDGVGAERFGQAGAQMYEDFFRHRGREVLFFRYAPPKPERDFHTDLSAAKEPNPPYPDAPGWTHSVYYYWYRFLRTNKSFQRQVQGEKPMPQGSVAQDFQHIFDLNFRDWWALHGRYLFCEPADLGIRVEDTPVDADRVADRLLLSIPAHADLERTLADIRVLLQPLLANKKAETGGSRARYPVWTKPVLTSLDRHLRAWKAHLANPDLNFVQLADLLGIEGAATKDADIINKKSAIAGRLVRQSAFMVQQAALGRFPVMNEKQLAAGIQKFPRIPQDGAEQQNHAQIIDELYAHDPEQAAKIKQELLPHLRSAPVLR